MKTFFWTTLFWILIFFGFVLYMKSFNAQMANSVCSWFGATNVAVQDTFATGMVTLTDIRDMLLDIQAKLSNSNITGDTISVVNNVPEVSAPQVTAE